MHRQEKKYFKNSNEVINCNSDDLTGVHYSADDQGKHSISNSRKQLVSHLRTPAFDTQGAARL